MTCVSRTVMLLVVVVAALALLFTERATNRAPTPGIVYWKADAELPASQEWASACTAANRRGTPLDAGDPQIQRVRAPVAQGLYAYRIELGRGQRCFGDARAELGQGNPGRAGFEDRLFQSGEDRWIAFQVLLPQDFDVGFPSWRVIWQLHQAGDLGTPVLALHVERGLFQLYRSDANRDSGDTVLLWQAPAVRGRWVRFAVHVKFSSDPSGGLVELWGDPTGPMTRLLAPTTTFTMKVDHSGKTVPDHARIGVFRDPNGGDPADVVYYDGFTVGSTRAVAEKGAFG